MQTLITAHAVTILHNYGRTKFSNFMKSAIFLPQSVLNSHYSLIENILCVTEVSHPSHLLLRRMCRFCIQCSTMCVLKILFISSVYCHLRSYSLNKNRILIVIV